MAARKTTEPKPGKPYDDAEAAAVANAEASKVGPSADEKKEAAQGEKEGKAALKEAQAALADGPLGAVAGNQQPVAVLAYKDPFIVVETSRKVTPLVGIDGGDGTRAARATKVADNAWTPFHGLSESTDFVAAPATRITTTGDDTASIAAGLANL